MPPETRCNTTPRSGPGPINLDFRPRRQEYLTPESSGAGAGGYSIICFFAVVAFLHLTPISDPDLFWHLATGRWIWEHGQLPDVDPFNYTTGVKALEELSMARVVSRQYWFANLLQYASVNLADSWGLLCQRVFFALLTMLMVYLSVRRRGVSVVASLLLLAPLGYVVASYAGNRPNQMTFFFLAAFLYLIEEARRRGSPVRPAVWYLLPFLMLFWANVHGGFILGAAIAVIYLVSELLRTLLIVDHGINKRLIFALVVTIFTGLLNPNGYDVVSALIRESSPLQASVITELMRPFDFIVYGTYRYLVEVVSYVSVAAVSTLMCAVAAYRRHDETRGAPCLPDGGRDSAGGAGALLRSLLGQAENALLVALFGFMSFAAVRFIPLLAIASTPIIGAMFSTLTGPTGRKLSGFMIPEAALAVLLASGAWRAYPHTVLRQPLVSEFFPEPAVAFIRENKLQGRLFNYYDWGGFLIWKLYPDKVVFADGRGLSQRAYFQYLSVIGADRSKIAGVPVHKAVLDSYSVRTILIPATGRDGGLVPLVALLENDPEWRLVFCARNCLLSRDTFPRDVPKIAAYAIAMESAYASLDDDPRPYLAVARANLGLGRWKDAAAYLEGVLKSKPSFKGGPVERALSLVLEGRDILREDTGLP